MVALSGHRFSFASNQPFIFQCTCQSTEEKRKTKSEANNRTEQVQSKCSCRCAANRQCVCEVIMLFSLLMICDVIVCATSTYHHHHAGNRKISPSWVGAMRWIAVVNCGALIHAHLFIFPTLCCFIRFYYDPCVNCNAKTGPYFLWNWKQEGVYASIISECVIFRILKEKLTFLSSFVQKG